MLFLYARSQHARDATRRPQTSKNSMTKKKPKQISHASFNGLASKALRSQLDDALQRMAVHGQVVDSWSGGPLNKFVTSCRKYFAAWLNDGDVSEIVISQIYDALGAAEGAIETVPLSDILSQDQLHTVAEEVMRSLSSLPRQYEILFPLPNMQQHETDLVLSPTVALICATKPGTEFLHGILGHQLLLANPASDSSRSQSMYLKLSVRGYASSTRTQSAMRDATALLKRTIQIGRVKAAITTRATSYIKRPPISGRQEPILLNALIYDTSSGRAAPRRIPLGLAMSACLNDLCIDTIQLQCAIRSDDSLAHPDFQQRFFERLREPVTMLTAPDLHEDLTALASALEWAFDADADDEGVLRCIKTCIALEAALSEDSDVGGITERLADRLAYLLGNSPADRRALRDRMREFYQLRSKLVHGKKSALSNEDHDIERFGPSLLNMVLRTELKALEKWQALRKEKAMH